MADNIAQNDPSRFASLLTAKLSRLSTRKHEDQLDRDSGMESFQDAVSVSYLMCYMITYLVLTDLTDGIDMLYDVQLCTVMLCCNHFTSLTFDTL